MKQIIENLYEMASTKAEQNLTNWRDSFEQMMKSAENGDYEGYDKLSDQCMDYERKYLESIKERETYLRLLLRLGEF